MRTWRKDSEENRATTCQFRTGLTASVDDAMGRVLFLPDSTASGGNRAVAQWNSNEKGEAMTMEQEWQRYQARVYPGGMPQIQHDELRKAFMAGAGAMFVTMMKNAQQPMAQAMDATKATEDDIYRELSAYATKPEARN